MVSYWLGFVLDLIIGDPEHWPHPIRFIGAGITCLEKIIRRACPSDQALRIGGAILWLVIVGGSCLISVLLLNVAFSLSFYLGTIIEIVLVGVFLATKSLRDAALGIYHSLHHESLTATRKRLSYIVGRDTQDLDEAAITKATVETVAENLVDGIIAPLFYLFIGGVPLMVAYKAVNTLDSMVGYNTTEYGAIGYVSAKMDDGANYVPARLSLPLISLSAYLMMFDWKSALTIGWRDRYNHKSPNSAWSEAAVAGALGIALGGGNKYFGQYIAKPLIGDAVRPIEPEDINKALALMMLTALLSLMAFSLCWYLTHVIITTR